MSSKLSLYIVKFISVGFLFISCAPLSKVKHNMYYIYATEEGDFGCGSAPPASAYALAPTMFPDRDLALLVGSGLVVRSEVMEFLQSRIMPRFVEEFAASEIPLPVMADSYKAGHFRMYPEALSMSAYGEFRTGMSGMGDNRFVFYGLSEIVEKYLERQWTVSDVERAALFYGTHNANFSAYQFPKELFLKFIAENDGYFPVRLEALPEGTVAHARTPVFVLTAEGEYSRLCTFLETVLTMVWYPSTVATLSRYTKELIRKAFEVSVDASNYGLLEYKLHDFGFRACTCVEQGVIGGKAHLLNFRGTDTMVAGYSAQFKDNGGRPVGTSVPASEHSVMTSWRSESLAIANLLEVYAGEPIVSCVMDSYDYDEALATLLPPPAAQQQQQTFVIRPDSGNAVDQVLKALKAADERYGHRVNGKGFKCLKGAGVIQGDGLDYDTIGLILEAVMREGYSVQDVSFGMGGGLLQKVNRDTMSFATKLSHIVYADGEARNVMKRPKTDSGKFSLPGLVEVGRNAEGVLTAYPKAQLAPRVSALRVVYDRRPVVGKKDDFDTLRERVETQWRFSRPNCDPLSAELRALIA